jgi:hypothetical protein
VLIGVMTRGDGAASRVWAVSFAPAIPVFIPFRWDVRPALRKLGCSKVALTIAAYRPAGDNGVRVPFSSHDHRRGCGGMPHVNVNLIYVGWENFTSDDVTAVNDASWSARQIYWQVGFDLFGWWTYSIPVADAEGYSYIDQDAEAQWLTAKWSIPGDGVDIFLVKGYVGPTAGLSPQGGPCDKDLPWPYMTGAVVEMTGTAMRATLPHELGHYLGLDHDLDPNNLMYFAVDEGGPTSTPVLTFGQGVQMAAHCFTHLP